MTATPTRRPRSDPAGRARDHRHDLRVVRQPDRAQAQQARRRHRDGQLRHREGQGHLPGGASRPTTCSPPSRQAGYAAALPDAARRRADGRGEPTTDPLLRSGCWSAPPCPCRSSRWRWCRRCSSTYWQWLSLTLAAPVVVWGALPFHRAAWVNLRHGATTMDTLVSVGTLAAFGWSLYALFLGTAGDARHDPRLRAHRSTRTDGAGNIYLEAAAGVTTFLLAGR